MDKSKIIDYVTSDWAMRSPDGLISGYSVKENIDALKYVLTEYGLEQVHAEEIVEKILGEKKERKIYGDDRDYLLAVHDDKGKVDHLISYGHPDQDKHPDGQKYTGTPQHPLNKYKKSNQENIAAFKAAAERDPFFKALREEKGISLDNVSRIKDIFTNYPDKNAVALFKSLFNTITDIPEAIKIYEGSQHPSLQGIINKMDSTKFSGAGRGELPFVILLKDAKSGGVSKLDILFGEEEIEVKEVQSQGIKISAPTLKDYSKSEFNIAVHELALAATRIDGIEDFLLKVLNDNGDLYKKIDDPQREKHIEAIKKFFNDPKVGELTYFLLDAIFIISTKLMNKSTTKKEPKAKIDIDLGDKHKELKVPEKAIPDLQTQLSGITDKSGPSKLSVIVAPTEETTDEYMEDQVMKLSFFKENWDQQRVQDEIVGKVISKKYTKLLVVDKSKGNKATLYGPDTIKNLEFYGVGFGKIHLLMPGGTKPSELSDAGD